MKHIESDLQIACFKLFRLSFKRLDGYFFAIPNGGRRSLREAARLKKEGVMPGVSDAFLAIPKNNYAGLWIEFKTGTGKQTDYQKTFEKNMLNAGYDYKVVRSIDEFLHVLTNYLHPI